MVVNSLNSKSPLGHGISGSGVEGEYVERSAVSPKVGNGKVGGTGVAPENKDQSRMIATHTMETVDIKENNHAEQGKFVSRREFNALSSLSEKMEVVSEEFELKANASVSRASVSITADMHEALDNNKAPLEERNKNSQECKQAQHFPVLKSLQECADVGKADNLATSTEKGEDRFSSRDPKTLILQDRGSKPSKLRRLDSNDVVNGRKQPCSSNVFHEVSCPKDRKASGAQSGFPFLEPSLTGVSSSSKLKKPSDPKRINVENERTNSILNVTFQDDIFRHQQQPSAKEIVEHTSMAKVEHVDRNVLGKPKVRTGPYKSVPSVIDTGLKVIKQFGQKKRAEKKEDPNGDKIVGGNRGADISEPSGVLPLQSSASHEIDVSAYNKDTSTDLNSTCSTAERTKELQVKRFRATTFETTKKTVNRYSRAESLQLVRHALTIPEHQRLKQSSWEGVKTMKNHHPAWSHLGHYRDVLVPKWAYWVNELRARLEATAEPDANLSSSGSPAMQDDNSFALAEMYVRDTAKLATEFGKRLGYPAFLRGQRDAILYALSNHKYADSIVSGLLGKFCTGTLISHEY